MAVKLNESIDSIITLEFVPKGFIIGAFISLFGIFMFVIWTKILYLTNRNI